MKKLIELFSFNVKGQDKLKSLKVIIAFDAYTEEDEKSLSENG